LKRSSTTKSSTPSLKSDSKGNVNSETKRNVVFLFGPTAVGKTQLLCDCFSKVGEVVNADSVQVYRGLDIGSAKADPYVQSRIPHHLIDILDPWENYNVADFIRLADAACEDIWSRGLLPVVSGGTAFYFKHFLYGLSQAPKSDPAIRDEVASYISKVGLMEAHRYLSSIDPVSGARINPNDGYRISRALEVYRTSGKPLSSFELPHEPRNGMNVVSIGLCRDRDVLRKRIKARGCIMFEQGIVGEIRNLLEMGASPSWQSMQGIGYKEFLDKVWRGDSASSIKTLDTLSKEELSSIADEIEMNSIHYAKRQMTFFKSFANVKWLNPGVDESQNGSVLKTIVETELSVSL